MAKLPPIETINADVPSTIHDTEGMNKYINRLQKSDNLDVRTAGFMLESFKKVWTHTTKNGNTPHPILDKLFLGRTVKANHPITVLNPTETFEITEYRISLNQISVRGEDTCWWGLNSITLVD